MEKHTALFSKSLLLPRAEDFNSHSTEALIPPLEAGTYMLTISGQNSFGKKGFSFGFLRVTNLTLSQTTFESAHLYRSLDRTTGYPEENVHLDWVSKENIVREKITDENGEVFVKKPFNRMDLDYLHGDQSRRHLNFPFLGRLLQRRERGRRSSYGKNPAVP